MRAPAVLPLLLQVGTAGWAVLLVLAAMPAALPAPLESFVFAVGHLVCHQHPERSFAWAGDAWPVCARCTGLYLGAAIGLALSAAVPAGFAQQPARVRRAIGWAVVPALVSVLFEWITGIVPSNGLRAITGLVAGAMVAALLLAFVRNDEHQWHGGTAARA